MLDFVATGICGVLNFSIPLFGELPSRNAGYHFYTAGNFLSQAFLKAKYEEKDKPSEQAEQLELFERTAT